MNTIKIISRVSLAAFCLLGAVPEMNGQILKKLGKAAERAAERTVERRVEQETAEKTDQALDSIFEPGSKQEDERQNPIPNTEPSGGPQIDDNSSTSNSGSTDNPNATSSGDPASIAVYSKFDFVPGDKILFFDDFSNDFEGEFSIISNV